MCINSIFKFELFHRIFVKSLVNDSETISDYKETVESKGKCSTSFEVFCFSRLSQYQQLVTLRCHQVISLNLSVYNTTSNYFIHP